MIQLINDDCLNAIDKMIEEKLLIDFILTDPPYQFNKSDNGGGGMLKTRKYDKQIISKLGGNGLLDCGIERTFLDKTKQLFKIGYNAIFFCNQHQLDLYINFAKQNKYRFNVLVWNKTNPTPTCNNKYLDDIEFMVQIKSKDYKIGGTYATKKKVYSSPINKKDKLLWEHPTCKPIELLEKHLINHTRENDIVLDMFMGSGSTGVACLKTNRSFIGIEIDKNYFDIAEKRIKELENE